jgi:hypothetical protein
LALIRADVSAERIAFSISVKSIGKLGTTLAATNSSSTLCARFVPSSLILFNLMMESICSSKMSVLTKVTLRHISEGDILHGHRRESLKSEKLCLFLWICLQA